MATVNASKRKADIIVDSITSTGNVTGSNLNISNWDIAHGWGNHASAGYITSIPSEYLTQTEGDSRYYTKTVSDLRYAQITGDTFTGNVTAPTFTGSLRGALTGAPDATIWCVSGQYDDWGIFYDEGNPDKIQYRSGGTTTATIALDTGAGYFNGGLTTGTNGDIATGVGGDLVAYGHVTASYGYVSASSGASGGFRIGGTRKDLNWDTAYGWGDHSTQGYLTTYTDTTYSTATSGTLGLVKIGYAENGKNYPVELSNGQMFVNVPWVDTNTNTWRPIHDTPVDGATTTSISSNWAFDNVKKAVPANAVFTDTVYTHPTHPGDDLSVDTGALTGATVISDLDFNVTTDTLGHVTDANATYSTRNLTAANIGAAPASHSHSYLPLSGGTITGNVILTGTDGENALTLSGTSPTLALTDTGSEDDFYIHVNGNNFYVLRDAVGVGGYGAWTSPHPLQLEGDTNRGYLFGQRMFADNYHPNADKWTTARTISLSGDLTGSVSLDGSSNVTLSAQVVNDSHTHDGRYVNVTGDTMTGTLTVPNLTIGSGNKIKFANNDYIRYDDVANRFHFDSDGGTSNASVQASTFVGALSGNASTASKWATARSHTVTLTGDVTGSTTQSVDGTGNITWSIATTVRQPAVGNWFNNGHPLVGTDGVMEIGKYIDFHNSSSTTSDYTARITNTGNHLYASGRWYVNSNQRVFADDYHPNADKWTSARTLTLSGDLTGSVSIDGSSNVTLSAQVSNDSHNHDHSDGDFSVGSNITANRYFQRASGIPTNNLGSPTVTEMALFDGQFNNKTEYYPPSSVRFYQTVDGTTWTEITTYSDDQKKRFLHGDATSGVVIPNLVDGFRIEVESQGYVFLNALYMYWSSNSHSTKVHVYRRRNSDGAWLGTATSDANVSSWPGHLYLPFNTITFNPSNSSQHNKVRIEFLPNWSGHATYGDRNINLYSMQLWGGYPAGRRNVYYTDQDHNVDFPSEVKGTSFNADSELKINGTTVIDSSRNLTSIGNIGASGAVTANGFNVSTLGGITQAQGEFGIGSGNVGIHFNNSGDNLLPFNHGTLAFSNGVIDFGHESYRYKDGFFSGKISVSALEVYGNSIKFANLNDSITFEDTGNVYSFNTDGGTGNAPVRAGSYQVGTTTVIDSSRNIKDALRVNIGQSDTTGASNSRYLSIGGLWAGMGTSASLIVNGFGRINGNLHLHQEGTNKSAYFNNNGSELRLLGENMTGRLEVQGALRVTESGTAQHFLIGNQDSGGVNKPAMIRGVNGYLTFGHGSSWSGEGGTMTEVISLASNQLNLKTGNYQVNGTTVIDSSRNLVNVGSITATQLTVNELGGAFKTYDYGTDIEVNATGGWARSYRLRNSNDGRQYAFGARDGYAYISTNYSGDETGYAESDNFRVYDDGSLRIGTTTFLDTGRNATFTGLVVGGGDYHTIFNANTNDSRVLKLRDRSNNTGNIVQFQEYNGGNLWEVVGRKEGTYPFYIYKNWGTGSGFRLTFNQSGHAKFWGNLDTGGVLQVGGTTVIDSSRNLTNIGHFQNGSMWVNDGSDYNGYNENIRLFNAPNGVSVIGFSCSGISGTPTTSLLGYSDRFETRVGSTWRTRVYGGYLDVNGYVNSTGYRVGSTEVINSSRNLINLGGSIKSDSTFHFLTSTSNAQYGRFRGISTHTSYSIGVYSGEVNAWSGFRIANTQIVDASRNLVNINAITATGSGMGLFSTNMSSNDDWQNSPISIRERGMVSSAQSADTYAPNLNFHWAGRASNSLWMNSSGHLVYGSYSSTGTPNADGSFASGDVRTNIVYDLADTSTYLEMRGDGGGVRVKTSNGYIDFGAQNSSWAHIITDRSGFYFNTGVTVDSGIVQSYNEDLVLRRAGSSSHQMTLNTSGATFTGNVTAYSDVTLKDNITNIDNALDKVNSIRGVTYDRIDQDNARHAGVIAQEVEAVLPEVVHTDDDGIKSVAYGNMVGLLIEAIKELKQEIEELKNG